MSADKYINIATPVDGAGVSPGQPLLVSGTGKGLFEGNVVIRITGPGGERLVQTPTTMQRDDIAAEGEWQINITLPANVPDTIRLMAYSPSPREGDAAITSQTIVLTTRQQTGLDGSSWRLNRYRDARGKMVPVLTGTSVTAHFKGGKLNGSAGCNRYSGTYTTGSGEQLGFSDSTATTMMACVPPVAEQERVYLHNLSLVAGYQQQEGLIQMLDKDGQAVLEYVAVQPLALAGTYWKAAGINNGKGGVVSSATTGLATARFSDGKISGHAGCNSYNASYEVTAGEITIGPAMSTRMHCAEPDGIMDQEQAFLQALSQSRKFELTRERLKLRDDKGSLQIDFVAGEAGPQ